MARPKNTNKAILKLAQEIIDIAKKEDEKEDEQKRSTEMEKIDRLLQEYPLFQKVTLDYLTSRISEAQNIGLLDKYRGIQLAPVAVAKKEPVQPK